MDMRMSRYLVSLFPELSLQNVVLATIPPLTFLSQKNKLQQIPPCHAEIYLAIASVPKGRITTHKILADQCNTTARTVEKVSRRNPILDVPFHRVVKSNLSLQGKKVQHQIKVLEQEGVEFITKTGKGAIVDGRCVYHF